MNRRSFFPVLIAVVAAVIYFLVLYLAKGNLTKAQTLERVAIAKVDLEENHPLEEKDITWADIPSIYVQKDAYKGSSLKDIQNLVTKVAIGKGNQITKPSLTTLNPEMGISLKVRPGNRAYILPINNQIAKMIKPGDKVDVIIIFDANLKTNTKEKMAVTILQDVLVLGVGSNFGQGLDNAAKKQNKEDEQNSAAFSDTSVLTLALGLIESQYLSVAQEEGEINVVVRSRGDSTRGTVSPSRLSDIFKG